MRKVKTTHQIIDGHGTGLMPPTEKQWEEMKNQPILIDRIESTLGAMEVPSSWDNSATNWFPPIGSQGSEGSCVSWACGYYTKTFQEAKEHNWNFLGCKWENGSWEGYPSAAYQDKIFSPDFIYHQVNGGSNNGSSYSDNMNLLQSIGCCTWDKMPCDRYDYTTWPSENAWRQAPLYRSQSYGSVLVDWSNGLASFKTIVGKWKFSYNIHKCRLLF